MEAGPPQTRRTKHMNSPTPRHPHPSRPSAMASNPGDTEQRSHHLPSPSLLDKSNISNPHRSIHPNFKSVEATRPDWRKDSKFTVTKTKNPEWKYGDGASDGGESLSRKHVEIDPHEEGRPTAFNHKLLISGIVPRPIGFVSTRSEDGSSTNLAPFSYTNVICNDPPLFTVGFAGGFAHAKDTLRNLVATRECTINIISEHFLEAANSTAINSPYGISEWALSGLTPAPCTLVSCSRVQEAIFSIEGHLVETREFESKKVPGRKSGVLAIVEGVRFWVREDAINEERNFIDPLILRPMSRLGGIMYGRTVEAIELPRLDFGEAMETEARSLRREKVEGQ